MAKVKELESSKDDKTDSKRVRFGGDVGKKDADALKAKQDELDKLKLNFTKVIIMTRVFWHYVSQPLLTPSQFV